MNTDVKTDTITNEAKLFDFDTSKVVAIIDSETEAGRAFDALKNKGFDISKIDLFCGLDGEFEMDIKGKYHGYIESFRKKLHHFMLAEGLQLDFYEEALVSGSCVLQVHTDSKSWENARDVLRSNGGHFINFYGLLTTEVLFP